MNWLQLIERRRSVRQYEPVIDAATVARVKGICQETESCISAPLELKVLPGSQVHGVVRGYLGAYGRVLSPWYIAAISPSTKEALFNLGYCTERAILKMTALGLGTCWIGGFFDKNSLKNDLGLEKDQAVAALTALGWPGKEKSRIVGQSGRRVLPKKIAVFDSDRCDEMPWRAVLEAVRWAPSALNRQPWRLWFSAGVVHLYSSSGLLARAYTPIEMGIALCHIELACKQLAISGHFSEVEHPQRKRWEYWVSFVRD